MEHIHNLGLLRDLLSQQCEYIAGGGPDSDSRLAGCGPHLPPLVLTHLRRSLDRATGWYVSHPEPIDRGPEPMTVPARAMLANPNGHKVGSGVEQQAVAEGLEKTGSCQEVTQSVCDHWKSKRVHTIQAVYTQYRRPVYVLCVSFRQYRRPAQSFILSHSDHAPSNMQLQLEDTSRSPARPDRCKFTTVLPSAGRHCSLSRISDTATEEERPPAQAYLQT